MPLRDDLLMPVAGDNPSGANVRYDPIFDKIKEARREDIDAPQGEWKTSLKTADYGQVVKLAGEVIAMRSKDLQIAAWLVEAHVRREGFQVLGPSFRFVRELLENFWETLYPEIEDEDDIEIRCGPLDFIGSRLEAALKQSPITANRLGWFAYQTSRAVGYESEDASSEKRESREKSIKEGKMTAEQFDEAANATPMGFYANAYSALTDGLTELARLVEVCDAKFGPDGPSFTSTRKAMEEVRDTVASLLRKKGGAVPADTEEEESADEAANDSGPLRFTDELMNVAEEESLGGELPGDKDATVGDTVTDFGPLNLGQPEAGDEGLSVFDSGIANTAAQGAFEPQGDDDVARQLTAICKFLRTNRCGGPHAVFDFARIPVGRAAEQCAAGRCLAAGSAFN